MGNENLTRARVIALAMIGVVVVLAGCAGPLGLGGGSDAATPTADSSSTATPAATPAPTATPTPTATPMPTATPTPLPLHLDYERYGREVAEELNTYVEGGYASGTGNYDAGVVRIAIRKPDDWTVQDAEMEVAREVARFSAHLSRSTADEAKELGGFVRPDEYQVIVVDENGTELSQVTIDATTADQYAIAEVDLETYAEHVADSREVLTNDDNVTISEGGPEVALRGAEYRPIVYFHKRQIERGDLGDDDLRDAEFERVEILASEKTIYYESVHEEGDNIPAQSSQVQRTYLETIKIVWKDLPRVNRLPETVKYYQDTSQVSYADPHSLIPIQTRWALDYFELSHWVMPQDKTMTAQELDAYYNRITHASQFSDDGFDYLNETSEASRYVPTYPD